MRSPVYGNPFGLDDSAYLINMCGSDGNDIYNL